MSNLEDILPGIPDSMAHTEGANQASTGTRLDPWYGAYAARTRGMKASETRALFAVANRPEVVSLAGGMPFLEALPMEIIAKVTADLIATEGQTALQYGAGQGLPQIREHITEIMAEEGVTAHPDDVVVTTGSQQALDIVTRIFCDPGDIVLAESPSYVGALGVFRSYQANVVQIDMDENGLIPDALRETIDRCRKDFGRIKFLYTCPTFNNPAGVTLSRERRREVLEICRDAHILVVEDNAYGMLSFDGTTIDAIRSLDEENVLYLGTFSKTLAPGYRMGWVVAPPAVRDKLVLASESSILCPSHVSQMSISTYLETCDWRGQIQAYRGEYHKRAESMLSALAEYMPECQWTVPTGGFYTWVTLPDGLDSRAMLPRATTGLVAYVPGSAFYADGVTGTDHMRLSFCYPTPERIREGIKRLGKVIAGERELTELFGTKGGTRDGVPGIGDVVNPAPNIA